MGRSEPRPARDAECGGQVPRSAVGADHRGQRLNTLHRENITEAEILAELDALFARYAGEREADERFGDFLHRAGLVALPPYPTHVLVEPASRKAALGEAA